jgi:Ankyrin repeats (3 copies)
MCTWMACVSLLSFSLTLWALTLWHSPELWNSQIPLQLSNSTTRERSRTLLASLRLALSSPLYLSLFWNPSLWSLMLSILLLSWQHHPTKTRPSSPHTHTHTHVHTHTHTTHHTHMYNITKPKRTPLHTHIAHRNANNKQQQYRQSPLHIAAAMNNVDAVQRLLKKGADVNATDKTNWTPLHAAVSPGNWAAAEALLQCDDIDACLYSSSSSSFCFSLCSFGVSFVLSFEASNPQHSPTSSLELSQPLSILSTS